MQHFSSLLKGSHWFDQNLSFFFFCISVSCLQAPVALLLVWVHFLKMDLLGQMARFCLGMNIAGTEV